MSPRELVLDIGVTVVRSLRVAGAAVIAFAAVACGRETVVAVTVGEPRPVTGLPRDAGSTGPGLHTDGAHIVDESGTPVHLHAITWFGLETSNYAPQGLWARSMDSLLTTIGNLGFNTLRIPWSSQLLDPGSIPNGFDPNDPNTGNADLHGLDGTGMLRKLVDGAAAHNLYVILAHRASSADSNSPTWTDSKYDDKRFVDDWTRMAQMFENEPHVIGCELHTDLRDPTTWGDGSSSSNDWHAAAERAGDAILRMDPRFLIIVGGVESAGGSTYWRGGNLRGVMSPLPVELSVPGKVVYATEDFPQSVAELQPQGGVPWLTDPTFPMNLPGVWDQNWGYIAKNGTAPVFVAAFGTQDSTAADNSWFKAITTYIGERDLDFAYFALNANANFGVGILEDDWQTPRPEIVSALAPILAR